MASERVTLTAAMLYDAGREDGRRDAAVEIARLSRELEAALEREQRLREALERIGRHDLTASEARDVARRALATDKEMSDDERKEAEDRTRCRHGHITAT